MMMVWWFKKLVAKMWRNRLEKQMNKARLNGQKAWEDCLADEVFRQKWTHIQGQLLTDGKMMWSWYRMLGVDWQWLKEWEAKKRKKKTK